MGQKRRPHVVHSFPDLYNKAKLALDNSNFITIAILADSPNAAETSAKMEKISNRDIRSIQALARIKRDYPSDFWQLQNVKNAVADLDDNVRDCIEISYSKYLK